MSNAHTGCLKVNSSRISPIALVETVIDCCLYTNGSLLMIIGIFIHRSADQLD